MATLPGETVRALLAQEHEVPAAFAWTRRKGLDLTFDSDALTLQLPLEGPPARAGAAAEPYLITADLEDYDLLPPIWRMVDPRTGRDIRQAGYPNPKERPSIFHSDGLICAPWSRLAYKVKGGPHRDWGELTGWKSAASNYTHAVTIPDMLARLVVETASSQGRMAPPPSLP